MNIAYALTGCYRTQFKPYAGYGGRGAAPGPAKTASLPNDIHSYA